MKPLLLLSAACFVGCLPTAASRPHLRSLPSGRAYSAFVTEPSSGTPLSVPRPSDVIDEMPYQIAGVVVEDRGPFLYGDPLPSNAVLYSGCKASRAATFDVFVGEDGNVRSSRLVRSSGCPAADTRLQRALREAWFHPAFKNSRAQAAHVRITVPDAARRSKP